MPDPTADSILLAAAPPSGTSPLLARLEALRRRTLRLMLVRGAASVVGSTACGLLLLIGLDWLVRFPAAVRLAFGVGGLGGVSWLIATRLWPALSGQLSQVRLAGRIEARFPEFEDRLISAVSFATQPGGLSDPLHRKLLERTEEIARNIPIERVITIWPVWRTALFSVAAGAVLLGAGVLRPEWINLGLRRYLTPSIAEDWPKTVQIRPLTADLTVPLGASVVVSMEVIRGREHADRGVLYVRGPDGSTRRTVMRREGVGRYAWTLSDVSEDLQYWFRAGDDSTADQVGQIRVVQRPWVTDLRLEVRPPEYIDGGAVQPLPAGQKTVELIEGGRLMLRFRSSKPANRRRPDAVWLSSTHQGTLVVPPAGDAGYAIELAPLQDEVYHIHVLDEDGLENEDQAGVVVRVRADAPPTLVVTEPSDNMEVTPAATVRVLATARDDFGISRITLQGHAADRDFEQRLPEWITTRERGGVAARITHEWPLSSLGLHEGDTVEYALHAQDNRRTNESSAQVGRTPTRVLRVVNESEFRGHIADELSALATRLQRLLSRQEQLIDQTDAGYESLQSASRVEIDRTLMRLSARQRGLAEQAESIRRSVSRLLGALAQNGITLGREKQQGDVMATQLRNGVEPLLQQAAAELNTARAAAAPTARAEQVAGARDRQRQAAEAMARILNEFSVWDDYNSALVNLRTLIDMQQEVGRQTEAVQQKTLGQDLTALPDAVRDQVRQVAQAQDDVTAALDRTLLEMQRLHDKLRTVEPEDARVIQDTANRLRGSQAAQRSREAARAVAENRTSQAQTDQDAVERALAAAVNQLEDRLSRKLAELSKKMARAEDLLLLILQQQHTLRAETAAADPGVLEAWRPLAVRQRKLRNNTAEVAVDVAKLPQSGEATDFSRRAVADMADAAEALYERRQQPAGQAQEQAAADLEQAIALLRELRQNNEEALRKQHLFAIRRELQAVHTQQSAINAATGLLLETVQQAGRLTRIDVRRAKKEGRRQEALDQTLRGIQERLADAPVYAWVAARAEQAMQASAEQLGRGALQPELRAVQDQVIRYLDHLIVAVQQAEGMTADEFSGGPSEGGGGGPTTAGPTKAVPTVAELLVLKTLQEELLTRSQTLNAGVQDQQPTETQLEQARALGEEQRQLRELTRMLTDMAR